MIEMMKKAFATIMTLAIVVNFGLQSLYVEASENTNVFKVYDAVNEIMNEYSETLRLQNTEGLSEALNDTDKNDLLTAYLQWRIAVMQNMNCGYSEHTVQILNVTIETQSQEAVSVLVDYNENYI